MYIGFHHRKIIYILLLSLCSFPAYSQTKDAPKKDAPKWVNELPMSAGSIFAVGMVNRYFDKKAGEEAAAQAAKTELAQTIKVNVKTITSTWSGSSASGLVSSLEKSIDEDVMASVQNAKILETWVDPEGLTYALAELPLAGSINAIQKKVIDEAKKDAGKKDPKKIEKLEVSLKNLKDPKSYIRKDKPDWIKALPEEDDAIYALGIAEGYYYYVNGREAAKDKSRGELGQTIKSEVQAILTDWYEVNSGEASGGISQSFIEEMSNSVSEATLSGSQIVETWYDRTVRWHYALARMSLTQVINQVSDKAKEKVKDPKKLKGLSDKLGKLINRDYLKMQNGYPVWINKIPKDKGAIFAVGMDEGKYLSQTKGIEKAKESARTKLAKTIGVQIENVTKNWIEAEGSSFGGQPMNDYMSEITKEATNVSLEGSQIMASFVVTDKTGKQTYYALARLYTGGMLAKIKRKASQTIKVPEASSQEDKAQKILSSGRESAKAALEKLNAALDQLE